MCEYLEQNKQRSYQVMPELIVSERSMGSVGWYVGKWNTALKAASSEEEELFEGEKSSEAEL